MFFIKICIQKLTLNCSSKKYLLIKNTLSLLIQLIQTFSKTRATSHIFLCNICSAVRFDRPVLVLYPIAIIHHSKPSTQRQHRTRYSLPPLHAAKSNTIVNAHQASEWEARAFCDSRRYVWRVVYDAMRVRA